MAASAKVEQGQSLCSVEEIGPLHAQQAATFTGAQVFVTLGITLGLSSCIARLATRLSHYVLMRSLLGFRNLQVDRRWSLSCIVAFQSRL